MANIHGAVDVQDPAVRQSAVRVGSSTSQLNALMTKGRMTDDDLMMDFNDSKVGQLQFLQVY